VNAIASLWPPPRERTTGERVFHRPPHLDWRGPTGAAFDRLRERLAVRGIECGAEPGFRVETRVDKGLSTSPEGYEIDITEGGARVCLASEQALFPACATLAQWFAGCERTQRGLAFQPTRIFDAPTFAARGVMLDVSRTRVPTMATLFALVERLSSFKINQLQIYTEHTFAYVGHEDVWRDASPFTPDEVRDLDRYCTARGVELVPNQQSFGHLHRWLKHERYRELAEVPEGVDHAFSIEREPYSLDLSNPRALALLDDLYDQLLPCFSSRIINVGLDETFDLGLGRARERCAEHGVERVYLSYLQAVHAKIAARGRRMQFWGDIIVKRPELVPLLPKDAIALEWGYDAGHPFAEHAQLFQASGLEFYVCPGTSSWQSIAGRSANMRANLVEAARHGRANGASGYLITEWGDRGYLQPRVVSEVGLALGAGCAWNADLQLDDDAEVARTLDEHVFEDDGGAIGELCLALGRAGELTGASSTNGSPLFFLLAFAREPLPHPRVVGLTDEGLERARAFLADLRPRIERVRSRRPDASTLTSELRFACDLSMFACDFGRARLSTATGSAVSAISRSVRAGLATRLTDLIAEHRRLWSLRDRPGGLDESAAWLERIEILLAG